MKNINVLVLLICLFNFKAIAQSSGGKIGIEQVVDLYLGDVDSLGFSYTPKKGVTINEDKWQKKGDTYETKRPGLFDSQRPYIFRSVKVENRQRGIPKSILIAKDRPENFTGITSPFGGHSYIYSRFDEQGNITHFEQCRTINGDKKTSTIVTEKCISVSPKYCSILIKEDSRISPAIEACNALQNKRKKMKEGAGLTTLAGRFASNLFYKNDKEMFAINTLDSFAGELKEEVALCKKLNLAGISSNGLTKPVDSRR